MTALQGDGSQVLEETFLDYKIGKSYTLNTFFLPSMAESHFKRKALFASK